MPHLNIVFVSIQPESAATTAFGVPGGVAQAYWTAAVIRMAMAMGFISSA